MFGELLLPLPTIHPSIHPSPTFRAPLLRRYCSYTNCVLRLRKQSAQKYPEHQKNARIRSQLLAEALGRSTKPRSWDRRAPKAPSRFSGGMRGAGVPPDGRRTSARPLRNIAPGAIRTMNYNLPVSVCASLHLCLAWAAFD